MKWDRNAGGLKYSGWGAAVGLACLASIVLFGGYASGQELQDFGALPAASKMEVTTSKLKVEIASSSPIDIAPLLQTLGDDDSIEGAFQKIDLLRTKLYPKKELKLKIGRLDTTRGDAILRGSYFIDLETKIAWFNSSHAAGSGWVAKNILSGAAVCVVKITKGQYKFYYENPDKTWAYGGARSTPKVWAATTYGSDLYRGFKAVASGTGTNTSDIYMYFYFINYAG